MAMEPPAPMSICTPRLSAERGADSETSENDVQEKKLEVVPYDPGWPAAFEAEAVRLRSALGTLALRIDHHGSTSIPGLGAKPIIDIQVSVAALQPIEAYGDPLRAIGYVHVPHPDDSFCPFFHRPSQWPHSHHVHVVKEGGAEERRTLAFRDYLRDHPAAAREYEDLKQYLVTQLPASSRDSREAYALAKTDFIERIVAVALRSGYPQGMSRADQGAQPAAAPVGRPDSCSDH